MKKLWAPWRMTYIKEALQKEAGEECILCSIGKAVDADNEPNLVLARGKYVFLILNKFPYNNGHLMVVPYKHAGGFSELSDEAVLELWRYAERAVDVLKKSFNPDGFNIGFNLGRVAGAGIEDHIHLHIVPRWSGDTNFMPILSDTKVISQALSDTWAELSKCWNTLFASSS